MQLFKGNTFGGQVNLFHYKVMLVYNIILIMLIRAKKPQDIFFVLNTVCDTLSISNEPRHLIHEVLDTLLKVLNLDCGWIHLLEPGGKRLLLSAYRGFTSDMIGELSQVESSPYAQVLKLWQRIIISDLSHEKKNGFTSFREAGFHSLLAVPLRTYRIRGAIGIAAIAKRRFHVESAELLEVIADFVGVTLDKIELNQRALDKDNHSKESAGLSLTSNPGKDNSDCNSSTELKEAGEETSTIGKVEEAMTENKSQIPPSKLEPAEPKNGELKSDDVTAPRDVRGRDVISVFIVDEKVISRQGLRSYLSQNEGIKVIGECDYFLEDTVSLIEELAPHVVLVDINLPLLNGLNLARQIVERSPNISIILLGPYEEDDQIFEALKVGVAGYLSGNIATEELGSAIQRVSEGNRIINNLLVRPGVARRVLNRLQDIEKATKQLTVLLSPQEKEMLDYFVKGYSVEKVAHVMVMNDRETKNHMANIVLKLVRNERIYSILMGEWYSTLT